MFKSKKFSLLMTIVFIFSMVFPLGTVFAAEDNVSISGSYVYLKADDGRGAGFIRIEEDGWVDGTKNVVVQLNLPDGVQFSDDTKAEKDLSTWVNFDSTVDAVYVEDANSSYFELRLNGVDDLNPGKELVRFDFSQAASLLDINDDFTGNLDVAVDVVGMEVVGGKESILWTDNDNVTIAKVSGGDVTVTVGDTKKVSVGGDVEVADITLEESMSGAFSKNEMITLEIETDGVEFASVEIEPTRLDVNVNTKDKNGKLQDANEISAGATETITAEFEANNDGEQTLLYVKVTGQSQSLPGKIKFDNILLDINPDVSGEIEISVSSNGDADIDETLTVAAVDDCDLFVTVDEDTGMKEHMRKTSINELWEMTIKTNGEYEKGDKIIITLPEHFEFYKKAVDRLPIGDYVDCMGTFDGDRSLWLEINSKGDGKDEITLKNLFVGALPDAEYGDINVEIGGDIGQATVKAGLLKPGVIPKPEQTHVVRGHNQLAGNITFTETDKDAIKNGVKFFMTLPNGVKFAAKPTVTVNDEEIDVAEIGPGKYDKDVCQITIDNFKSSQIDILKISNIRYDIEDWFMPGEVIKVKVGGNDPEAEDNFNQFYESLMLGFRDFVINGIDSWDKFQFKSYADETIVELPNAIIIDPNQVTASFTLGDEGVYVENGRTLVQVNLLTDMLGLQKSWDDATKTAYFMKDGRVVAFPLNQNKIYVNNAEIPVEMGGKIINGFTCVTLRGLEVAFGGKLSWDNETKTATFVFNK